MVKVRTRIAATYKFDDGLGRFKTLRGLLTFSRTLSSKQKDCLVSVYFFFLKDESLI